MQYMFILSDDASIDEIEKRLQLVDGINWDIVNGNVRVDVPEDLHLALEGQILAAIAAGTISTSAFPNLEVKMLEANVLCGALQSRLLDRYLPEVVNALKSGTVVEVDSINNELSMLRIRGPKETGNELDRLSAWLMSKCAVGVSSED